MPLDPAAAALVPEPVRSVFDSRAIARDLEDLADFPADLRQILSDVPPADLARTWRPGSWTVAQAVHHFLDSHLHAYMRCKFALGESNPSIKPYDENLWVVTPECDPESVAETVDLLDLLHRRWVRLFAGLDRDAWSRTFHHPERGRDFVLYEQVAIYAWHGPHHLAQICVALGKPLPE